MNTTGNRHTFNSEANWSAPILDLVHVLQSMFSRAHFTMFFILAITLALYFPVTRHAFVNFDDGVYVYENPFVARGLTLEGIEWAFRTAQNGMWHPLVWISFMVEVQLWGSSPGILHLTNVWLHVGNTLLLYLLFFRLTACSNRSALVAALFAWHPCHVETVAWISERKGVLSTTFWLITLLTYLKYVQRRKLSDYLMSLGTFITGCLVKPMLVSLPFVLLLVDVWPLKRIRLNRGKVNWKGTCFPAITYPRTVLLDKVPMLLASALFCYISVRTQEIADFLPMSYRVANMFAVLAQYIKMMILPVNLSIVYPRPEYWEPTLILFSISVLTVASYLAIRLSFSHPFVFFGWFWYAITVIPVSGIVPIGPHYMADRYTYVPYIGLFVVLAWAFPTLVPGRLARSIPVALGAILCTVPLLILSSSYVGKWRDSETLFAHALKADPNNYVANMQLCMSAMRKLLNGKSTAYDFELSRASQHALLSAAARPVDVAYVNLGYIAELQKKPKKAMLLYDTGVRLFPESALLHFRLARLLACHPDPRIHKGGEAVTHARTACDLTEIYEGSYPEFP